MSVLSQIHPFRPSPRLAVDDAGDALPPARVWNELSQGRLRVDGSYFLGDRAFLNMRVTTPTTANVLTPTELAVVVPVLRGEQQKVVASNLGVAPSTVSHRFVRALRKLGVLTETVPLALVTAVHLDSNADARYAARCARFDEGGTRSFVYGIRRPDLGKVACLTRAETEVARLFIEGYSRSDIALRRGTCEPTVARQVHSIFTALRLFGRYSLVWRAGELGCFE